MSRRHNQIRARADKPSKRNRRVDSSPKNPGMIYTDSDDESLKDFIVEDSASKRYIHREDSPSEGVYSYSGGFDDVGPDRKYRRITDDKCSRLTTEPLYNLLKDKIVISETGSKPSPGGESNREADVALSQLMEEVFSSLDAELREITAKQIQGPTQKVNLAEPDYSKRMSHPCNDTPGKSHGEEARMSEPLGSHKEPPPYGDLEDEFDDGEIDLDLLGRLEEIERRASIGCGGISGLGAPFNSEVHDGGSPSVDRSERREAYDPMGYESYPDTGNMIVYCVDALERDGVIYLFCKHEVGNAARTVCVAVKNFQRNIFFLPAKDLDREDSSSITLEMREEVERTLKSHGISGYTLEVVKKKYCFSAPCVPKEAYYLMASYPYTQPSLPRNATGRTFSKILCLSLPAIRLFLLKSKLMGPSWISINNFDIPKNKFSWCSRDLVVSNYEDIRVLDKNDIEGGSQVPELNIAALSLLTTAGADGNLIIIAISLKGSYRISLDNLGQLARGRFDYMYTGLYIPDPALASKNAVGTSSGGSGTPEFALFNTESSLLEYIISAIADNDPDILIGHDIAGGSLDTLISSLKRGKVENWSVLGRLKQKGWPKIETQFNHRGLSYDKRQLVGGRIICDIRRAAETSLNFKSYDLETMAIEIMNVDISKNCSNGFFYSYDIYNTAEIAAGVKKNVDIVLCIAEKLDVLPLTLQLANINGNLWSRSILGANSDGNEHFLSHEFYKRGFILPDKVYFGDEQCNDTTLNGKHVQNYEANQQNKSRRKPAYAGGLVLEPARGFYDTCVLLLDFNSLYPSIIREYNICFTTIDWRSHIDDPESMSTSDVSSTPGILPELIGIMVDERRRIRALMSNPDISEKDMKKYDIKQRAFKLAANSMYGCLGFRNSRFYAKPLASLITFMGREALKDTVDVSRTLGLNVIYGDTDSIMILTKTKSYYEALKIGNSLEKAINKSYSHIEIEVEAVISKILLHKKKKYACRIFKEQKGVVRELGVQVRGLEIVRREWCDLVHDSSSWILEQILSDMPRSLVVENIKEYLRKISQNAKSGSIPIEKFVIRKNLSKDPDSYPDKMSQPHVLVALALREKGVPVRAKDTIAYIICDLREQECTSNTVSSKARHYNEVIEESLIPDYSWYFSNQLLPSLSRLLEATDGIETACVAECLGLDAKKYASYEHYPPGNVGSISASKSLSSTFGEWNISCNACARSFPFSGAVYSKAESPENTETLWSGAECPNSECRNEISLQYISTSLHLFLRGCIRKYTSASVACEDQVCTFNSDRILICGSSCPNTPCTGPVRLAVSSEQLYKQLASLRTLVSISELKKTRGYSDEQLKNVPGLKKEYFDYLESIVQRYMDVNSYRFVNIASVLPPALKCHADRGINIIIPYS